MKQQRAPFVNRGTGPHPVTVAALNRTHEEGNTVDSEGEEGFEIDLDGVIPSDLMVAPAIREANAVFIACAILCE